MGNYPTEVTIEEGRTLILEKCGCMGKETVPVEESTGRVLAEDIYAKENIPPFARSPLDGYAFRACDTKGASEEHPVTLKIIEEIPAGKAPVKTIKEKEAAKILTGAPVPDGADAIEKYEAVEFTDTQVTLFREYRENMNIVPEGEDVVKGGLVMKKGTVISPAYAGLLAGLGYGSVPVVQKPRAIIISTGNELAGPKEALQRGKIRNSSSYALKGFLETAGAQVRLSGIVPDDAGAIADRIRREAGDADILVTTGGVSVGDYDMVARSMELLGAGILFWKVRMKPGMAFLAAVYEGKLVLCLSGNPSSAAVSLMLLGFPAVRKLAGREELVPGQIKVRLAEGFPKGSPGRRLVPGRLVIRDGEAFMELCARQGNGMLHPLHACDILGEIPAGSPPMEAGESIFAWKIFG